MSSKLVRERLEFIKTLEERIEIGNTILNDFNLLLIYNEGSVKAIEKRFRTWNSYNQEFLKQSFDNPKNEYSKSYEDTGGFHTKSIDYIMKGAKPDDINFRVKFFPDKIEAKIENLETLLVKASLLPYEQKVKIYPLQGSPKDISKVFISHASKDEEIVEEVIELLETIGLTNSQIFCSSFEGYGIELGENFLERLKNELDSNVLVLFILTDNFYNSPVCLCEMGAAWVKTNEHIPILVPPFDFDQVKGVFPLTQGFKINDEQKLNSFKNKIEKSFNIVNKLEYITWERRRNKIIGRINSSISISK